MKKNIVMLMLALLIAVTGMALAEQTAETAEAPAQEETQPVVPSFTVNTVTPEGYTYTDSFVSDILYIGYLKPDDETKPQALITIAYDEEAQGRTLNEMSDEEVLNMVEDFMQDTPDAKVSYKQTGEGTRLIVFNTETETENRIDIVTIYRGHQIAAMIIPSEPTTKLTEEDLDGVIAFLTNASITR